MRCSFRRKPAWSEPMAIRNGCSRDGDPASVEKARDAGQGRNGNRGSPDRSHPVRSLGGWRPEPLPRVTPYLLRRADSMCGRRLSRDVRGRRALPRPGPPVPPARRLPRRGARHPRRARRPRTAADFADVGGRLDPAVLPEERAVLEQAGRWYVAMFGDRPARWDDPGTDQPTDRGGLRVGGWIDLPAAHRRRRLRAPPVRALGPAGASHRPARARGDAGGVPPPHPMARAAHRCGSCGPTSSAASSSNASSQPTERPDTTDVVRRAGRRSCASAADDPVARSGRDCGGCAVVSACPEHRKGAHYGRKRRPPPRHPPRHARPGSTPGAGARASGATTSSSASPRATPTPAACTASSCTTRCT